MARPSSTPHSSVAAADAALDTVIDDRLSRLAAGRTVGEVLHVERHAVSNLIADAYLKPGVERASTGIAQVAPDHTIDDPHRSDHLEATRAAPLLARLGDTVDSVGTTVPMWPNDAPTPAATATGADLANLPTGTLDVARSVDDWYRCGRVLDVSSVVSEFTDPDDIERWLIREAARAAETVIVAQLTAAAATPGTAGVSAALAAVDSPYAPSAICGTTAALFDADPERLIASGVEVMASPLGPSTPIVFDPTGIVVNVTAPQLLAKLRPSRRGYDIAAVTFVRAIVQTGAAAIVA